MILCGTGHRPDKLGGYGLKQQMVLEEFAIPIIKRLNPEVIISGMALGWDMAIAMAADALKIPCHAYIPFVGQESRWPPDQQNFYRSLLAGKKVVVCSEGGYAPWKMQIRNEKMVDASDLVLALWNGSNGGTRNCVSYASGKGAEILNVWDEWEEFNES